MGVSLLLILAIGFADDQTGYALRLSTLYLAPIALVAWTSGARMGYGAAVLASLLWLFSFQSEHFYLHQAFYFWEAAAMLCGFLVFAWLSARLRQALQQADERFFRVLEEMHAAVFVADERADRIVYANPGMARIAGDPGTLAPSAFMQRFQGDIESIGLAPMTSTERGFAAVTVRDTLTGRWYLMQDGLIPWGGNPKVRLKVLTDITEQKHAERLREKHLEVIHQAAQLTTLAETAATLAHEINQPLMVIATYTDACRRLLGEENIDRAAIASALDKCHAQAVRVSSIIERLREFVRQRQHHPEPCTVHRLVTEAADILRPLLDETQVSVVVAQAMPAQVIEADRILLVQVLINLIRNAVDAVRDLPPARRQVSVDVMSPSRDELVISVSDHGPGLDADVMDKIFMPFFTSKPDGLGLGLTICRSVAEAHGGRLWAEPNPAGGTRFCLAMPARAS
jgi:two-component system, LuxR family, sensor histidine kinase DctS